MKAWLIALLFLLSSNSLKAEEGYCAADDEQCVNAPKAKVKIAKGANAQGKPPTVSFNECNDRSEQCKGFARQGECDKNPGWMIVNCPASCNACHLRDPKIRCNRANLNISTDPIFAPGEMSAMFRNIEAEFGDRYGVTVVSNDPWVVTFDNFLTDDEVNALITTAAGHWERSTDSGQVNEFGETGRTLSTGRTSSNAWCRQECLSNPHVQTAIRKIEEITRVPSANYESFQILQYELGQKYNMHHDMSERQCLLSSGPRILTFFLYLSDVEEGGETNFPYINISVKPKKGKAVLWPSVLDDNLERQDPRTNHAAAPVIRGTKYAANSWIHLYNFEKSNLWGCTGAFDYI